MGCVVFNFITTPCKYDENLSIIRNRRIKYGFVWVTSQILNTSFDILETRKSRCHSLGCYTTGCVTNLNSIHKRNVLYPYKSMYKFPWYYIYALWREFTFNGSAAISLFSYVDSLLTFVSIFIIFLVGNHSLTNSIMWSVWSTLKPRGDWKKRKFRYLNTYPTWNLISKFSSKLLLVQEMLSHY